MKFGVRECCDVVLRAKSAQKVGDKVFYKNEPVCYFDTLKTSTFEGAATTVYAQGGRGNARLMSWDGERTVTFTMEDALISPAGLAILTGAGLINAEDKPIIQHITEKLDYKSLCDCTKADATLKDSVTTYDFTKGIWVTKDPYEMSGEPTIYVMQLDDNGEVISEPYLFKVTKDNNAVVTNNKTGDEKRWKIEPAFGANHGTSYYYEKTGENANSNFKTPITGTETTTYLVDYYTKVTSNAFQIDITPDKFGGTFYLEASTLWRDQGSGEDLPAEFIIPNCKIQSNFSFTLASTGDPSSFTFTMDAFPGYTRWDPANKVLASIQVIGGSIGQKQEPYRTETWDEDGAVNPITQYITPAGS